MTDTSNDGLHDESTPRRRVMAALRHEPVDRVPFTVYENKLPQCRAERDLRNRGLCIVQRRSVVTRDFATVKVREEHYHDAGRRMIRTWYQTPAGTLSTLREPVGYTEWVHEKLFKRPEDYRALESLIRDEIHTPDYAGFARAEQDGGGDLILRANLGLEPLQALISGTLMDMTDFCVEWMERRDEILRLYEALVEQRRKVYRLVADSPATHANYGGNVTVEIIGPEAFRQYYLPHYNEAAEILHRHGKLLGVHLDGNCRLIAADVAATQLDYIEAFTPAPDTDMTLAGARAAWPGKVLWVNFPSSAHLRPDADVMRLTVELLEQAQDVTGLIMGITEDIPPDRWRRSCTMIMDGLARHAADFPQKYARAFP